MPGTASPSFSCCNALGASWSIKEPSSSCQPGSQASFRELPGEAGWWRQRQQSPGVRQQLLLPDRLPTPRGIAPSHLSSLLWGLWLQLCPRSASRSELASPPGACLVLCLGVKAGAISGPRVPSLGVRIPPPHAKETSASQICALNTGDTWLCCISCKSQNLRDRKAVGRRAGWALFLIPLISRSPCRGSVSALVLGGCSPQGAHPHSCSQARLCGCCFGKLNMESLAHPMATLSPSCPAPFHR